MGDPKKIKKKFKKPMHPWQKGRIDVEKELVKKYSLKNKQEVWKMLAILKNFKDQIKMLASSDTIQSEKEKKQLLEKISNLGLITKGGTVDDVLSLELENILDRRLQTIVFKKGLARSMKQARQFITHRHILVGDKKFTSPSSLVRISGEPHIEFSATSAIHNPDHPERIQEELSKTKITKKSEDKKTDSKTAGKEETKKKTQAQKNKEALKETPKQAAEKEVEEIITKEDVKKEPKAKENAKSKPLAMTKTAPSAEEKKEEPAEEIKTE